MGARPMTAVKAVGYTSSGSRCSVGLLYIELNVACSFNTIAGRCGRLKLYFHMCMFSNICSVLRAISCVHFFILLPPKGTAAAGAQFDPFNQARGPAPPLENKSEDRYSYLHSSI